MEVVPPPFSDAVERVCICGRVCVFDVGALDFCDLAPVSPPVGVPDWGIDDIGGPDEVSAVCEASLERAVNIS